jgi:hypothetical protein
VNKAQPFKVHHVARLLRGAARAGVVDPRVHIKTSDGTEFTVTGAGAKPAAAVVVRKPVAAVVRKPVTAVVARKPAATAVGKPRGLR